MQARKEELERVNAELEETNHGVLALYGELSDELERTNQGVVALYAEIDDKNRQLSEASESKTRFLQQHQPRAAHPRQLRARAGPAAAGPCRRAAHRRSSATRSSSSAASAEDLLRLVNELLDLAKAESGRLEAVVDDVDLAALFDELRGTTAPLVTPPRRHAGRRAAPGRAGFRTDRTLLRHLLRNLLSNAVKFTESGSVTMTADADAAGSPSASATPGSASRRTTSPGCSRSSSRSAGRCRPR